MRILLTTCVLFLLSVAGASADEHGANDSMNLNRLECEYVGEDLYCKVEQRSEARQCYFNDDGVILHCDFRNVDRGPTCFLDKGGALWCKERQRVNVVDEVFNPPSIKCVLLPSGSIYCDATEIATGERETTCVQGSDGIPRCGRLLAELRGDPDIVCVTAEDCPGTNVQRRQALLEALSEVVERNNGTEPSN